MNTELKNNIIQSLPLELSFYDLGIIRPQDQNERSAHIPTEDKVFVLFRVYSVDPSLKLIFLFSFDQGLESDLYLEMGNILASHFANQLQAQTSLEEVMITPPHITTNSKAIAQLKGEEELIHRDYVHDYLGKLIPVSVHLMLTQSEDGHA